MRLRASAEAPSPSGGGEGGGKRGGEGGVRGAQRAARPRGSRKKTCYNMGAPSSFCTSRYCHTVAQYEPLLPYWPFTKVAFRRIWNRFKLSHQMSIVNL
eukprot:scaffold110439_cov32-Tisochrysis_lutea.AAC.1